MLNPQANYSIRYAVFHYLVIPFSVGRGLRRWRRNVRRRMLYSVLKVNVLQRLGSRCFFDGRQSDRHHPIALGLDKVLENRIVINLFYGDVHPFLYLVILFSSARQVLE